MKIHPVNHPEKGGNNFCGPAVISIVTGMDTGEAARLIRHVNGKPRVTGTFVREMMLAFGRCGVHMITIYSSDAEPKKRPTLTQWLRDSKASRTEGRVFLVQAGNHWQIITGRRFCCGRVREIISIKDKRANRRARVKAVFELLVTDKIVIPNEARKGPKRIDPCRERLRKEEREHGFKGKLEWNHGFQDYVVPPCEIFPRGFSTQHNGWDETLERVLFFANDPFAYEESADEDGHVSL